MERNQEEEDPYAAIEYGDFATYFRHKKQKLQLQQDEIAALASPDTPQIFEGVIVYANGYTDPPVQDLRNMIVQRGGEFRQHLSKSSITHIIASNLTQAKMKEFRNYKVARPEWITESVKANKLLSWNKFSTLRVPQSFSMFGDRSLTSLSSTSSSSLVGQTEAVAETAPPGLAGSNHGTILCDDGGIALQQVSIGDEGSRETSAECVQEDEDFLLDDLDLDLNLLEFQMTPPNVSTGSGIAPLSKIQHERSEHQWDDFPTGMHTEGMNTEAMITVNPYARLDMPPIIETITELDDGLEANLKDAGTESHVSDNRHPTLVELSVPWNRLNSSVQPGFVEKFYQSSRLHYLSTWKAKLREITADIQKEKPRSSSILRNRTIMHIDFDCFFASVATRGKPELQNQPIAVAHGSGGSTSNSEIASCNYLAREFGVKNGMHLQRARALCPDLLVVPYEFQEYENISIEFYKILLSYADELQAVSVDEALVDVTSKCIPSWELHDHSKSIGWRQEDDPTRMDPGTLAERVREDIFSATGCHASVGIAPNILLAKLATKRAKPHGQYIWPSAPGTDETLRELQGPISSLLDLELDSSPIPFGSHDDSELYISDSSTAKKANAGKEFTVKDLPGVGYKITQDLQDRFSVHTLYDLQQVSKEELQRICGMKTGEMLYNFCRGIDETTLASDREKARQSVSAEISWGVRFENQDQVDIFIRDLAKEVSKRLKEIDRKAKSVVLKIMKRKEYHVGQWKHLGHGPVDQFARTGQLPLYSDDPELIAKEAHSLLQYFGFDVLDLRGLGIQMLKLNNDTVNTVSRSAFTAHDSMNQTTLTTAMFQQNRRVTSAVAPDSHGDTVSSNRMGLSCAIAPQEEAEIHQDVAMEVDSETFNELPPDIQQELLSHRHFVFVNQGQKMSSDSKGNDQKSKALQALPPWSQVDPTELMALSTPIIRDTLNEYAERRETEQRRLGGASGSTGHVVEGGVLPSPSKLDRSVLEALPPEIRAEIEQEYTHIMENHELIRTLADPNPVLETPLLHQPSSFEPQGIIRRGGKAGERALVRGRGRGRSRGRGRVQGNAGSVGSVGRSITTTQSEPNDNPQGSDHVFHSGGVEVVNTSFVSDLDEDFLAALPPDIRAEVESAHKLEVMKNRQKQASLTATTKNQSIINHHSEHMQGCKSNLEGIPLLERPTLMGLREVGELRNMLAEWVLSTLLQGSECEEDGTSSDSGTTFGLIVYDEGPNPEDVQSFSDYIARVIFMERDLERVRLLLRYLQRRIKENESKALPVLSMPRNIPVLISWREALERILGVAQRLVLELYGGPFVLD